MPPFEPHQSIGYGTVNTPDYPQFHPGDLLDAVIGIKNLKNDAALCRLIKVAPPFISKVRRGRAPVGASLLLRLHEETGLSIKALRELMGDRRERYRVSGVNNLQDIRKRGE